MDGSGMGMGVAGCEYDDGASALGFGCFHEDMGGLECVFT